MRTYGYARVSTKEQNLERQLIALRENGVEENNIKTDKQSGKDFNRQSYLLLKNELLRPGDTLVIKELDRLGRDMQMIKDEWRELQDKGINLVVIDQPILNTVGKSDLEKLLISNIIFELLSYMAEKERLKIRDRQREGIEAKKSRGEWDDYGRPRVLNFNKFAKEYRRVLDGDIKPVECMKLLGITKPTYYRYRKEYEVSDSEQL
ncbi:MAG: recombinase family protein [Clostridium sp.]|uniref:recombinase family protein n=1 Tax=Clostridium sp. TaxID=1506 RepID=UPI00290AF4D7|nr:recombinase family protein [Clostridium sp.]MDU5111208.1 recombinase family protein [Clostridium sp.]